jgi:hypothetical protein
MAIVPASAWRMTPVAGRSRGRARAAGGIVGAVGDDHHA